MRIKPCILISTSTTIIIFSLELFILLSILPHSSAFSIVAQPSYNYFHSHNSPKSKSRIESSLRVVNRNTRKLISHRPTSCIHSAHTENTPAISNDSLSKSTITRREFLPLATSTAITAGLLLTTSPEPSYASAEVDRKSGELFSPKSQMLGGGGSDAARGIPSRKLDDIDSNKKNGSKTFSNRENRNIQDIYNTRFITYLSRFLLTFDPAARAWWVEETSTKVEKESYFANFAESVEVGLTDYFSGPYGSYASVQAAKAGIYATAPATSSRSQQIQKDPFLMKNNLFSFWNQNVDIKNNKMDPKLQNDMKKKLYKYNRDRKQGVLNLLALLQARYTSKEEKVQLAILFSFISDPVLQPTTQITALLGETDNASIQSVEIDKRNESYYYSNSNTKYRTEQKINRNLNLNLHGGYSAYEKPKISIDPPPALGKDYRCARADPVMKPTSRILRIKVIDGGSGYTSTPTISIVSGNRNPDFEPCQATAILNRDGEIESIAVLNPGFGYDGIPLKKVKILFKSSKKGNGFRPATAIAEMEYAISDIVLKDGGNGYVGANLPEINVNVEPPEEDQDWVIPNADLKISKRYTQARVTEKTISGSSVKVLDENEDKLQDIESYTQSENIFLDLPKSLKEDPTKLLPLTMRPELFSIPSPFSLSYASLSSDMQENKIYTIPEFTALSGTNELSKTPSFLFSQYRTIDPIFGGIGFTPVTKRAMTLSASEYERLALSGAICTVLVRTMLNPLELIKTKIQLKNDFELMEYANKKGKAVRTTGIDNKNADIFEPISSSNTLKKSDPNLESSQEPSVSSTTETTTQEAIKSMIELRGPQSLFQSADVTFLASLVFGSLGFGATELFRRSFTVTFFEKGDGESELILLSAAAVATIVTSFAAAPFEMMRVRSMGLVEPKSFNGVLSDFLTENRRKKLPHAGSKASDGIDSEFGNSSTHEYLSWSNIRWEDIPPLFQGFSKVTSRELPFAVAKFLAFDIVAKFIVALINSQPGVIPVQVGVGTIGLAVSAFAGALAGIAGAFVSHPADLVLTLTSAADQKENSDVTETEQKGSKINQTQKDQQISQSHNHDAKGSDDNSVADWRPIVQELLGREGGIANLYVGFPARATFFFLVIGLQFFLYDYVKNIFDVGSDDLTLVLDVFYAVRQGLVDMDKI